MLESRRSEGCVGPLPASCGRGRDRLSTDALAHRSDHGSSQALADRNEAPGAAKNFWLFSSHFPPNPNTGSHRPAAFVRHAAANGWRAHVVTLEADSAAQSEDDAGAAEVVREEPGPYLHWRLEALLNGGLGELRALVRGAGRIGTAPDLVFATGPAFSSFAAAAFWAARTRAPLVLDYRDEWTLSPFDFVRTGAADRHVEAAALRRACRVVFTTEPMRRHAVRRFGPWLEPKSAVVPNGWEEEHVAAAAKARRRGGRQRIMFLGSLAEHTDPRGFLRAVAEAARRDAALAGRLRLCFVGPKDPEMQAALDGFPLPQMIESRPRVERADVPTTLAEADALILFADTRLSRYMPSKLFDYVGSGRPIVVWGSDGEAGRVVKELDQGIVTTSLEEVGNLLAAPPEATKAAVAARRRFMREHRRDRLARRLFTIFEECTD